MAAISIPATDVAATALQAIVTQIQALVTASTTNLPMQAQYAQMLDQAQRTLVLHLMSQPKTKGVTAASIIANGTYGS